VVYADSPGTATNLTNLLKWSKNAKMNLFPWSVVLLRTLWSIETNENGRLGTGRGTSGAVLGFVTILDCWQMSHSRKTFFYVCEQFWPVKSRTQGGNESDWAVMSKYRMPLF